ncbi:MAG: DUF4105 domain-containing protein [Aurantimonas endophytica]|uniref:Lnb N-terminal periplasmic domain-containing protein n=1 Tax=Aurantimonas endophytica TaxID=1522175 RepID=UPI0030016C00
MPSVLVVLALWFQLDDLGRWLAILATALISVWLVRLDTSGPTHAGWAFLVVFIACASLWWGSIHPSQHREWAPDVAHGVTARIEGSTAILHNVRNFDWRSEDDFTERWETREYDLEALSSVDLVNSTWGNPAIAHTLVSFGFENGDHVTFSAEIRRERHEKFSELGGFFKKFELVMIAADESDIVRLRTNARREDVSLYPLALTPAQGRTLFLTYLHKGNELAARPQFYNTITANCTTIVFQLARLVEPRIPMDWRILVSGYLPDYLYELGVIRTELPLEDAKRQARISRLAQEADPDAEYSSVIRSGSAHSGR